MIAMKLVWSALADNAPTYHLIIGLIQYHNGNDIMNLAVDTWEIPQVLYKVSSGSTVQIRVEGIKIKMELSE